MKEDKIIKNDILIADFMEAEYDKQGLVNIKGLPIKNLEGLKFNVSWDWIRPAWDKFKYISLDKDDVLLSNELDEIKQGLVYHLAYSPIGTFATYLSEAIKWYNENK